MALAIHTLAPKKGSRTKKFRVGRGMGSGSGKTSGRGTKGQRARTGGRKRLKLKGMKQMLLAYPKARGFQSRYVKTATVPLSRLASLAEGSVIDLETLKAKRLVTRTTPAAKIVGSGNAPKKLTVKGLFVSAGAKAAIEQAGGKVA